MNIENIAIGNNNSSLNIFTKQIFLYKDLQFRSNDQNERSDKEKANIFLEFQYFFKIIILLILKKDLIEFESVYYNFYNYLFFNEFQICEKSNFIMIFDHFMNIYNYYFLIVDKKFQKFYQSNFNHKDIHNLLNFIRDQIFQNTCFNKQITKKSFDHKIIEKHPINFVLFVSKLEYFLDKLSSLQLIVILMNDLINEGQKFYKNDYILFNQYIYKYNYSFSCLYEIDLLNLLIFYINWYKSYEKKNHLYQYKDIIISRKKNLKLNITHNEFNHANKQISQYKHSYDQFMYFHRNFYFIYYRIKHMKNKILQNHHEDVIYYKNIYINKFHNLLINPSINKIDKILTDYFDILINFFYKDFCKTELLSHIIWPVSIFYMNRINKYIGIEKMLVDTQKISLNNDVFQNYTCILQNIFLSYTGSIKVYKKQLLRNLYFTYYNNKTKNCFGKYKKLFKSRIEQIISESFLINEINNKNIYEIQIRSLYLNNEIICLFINIFNEKYQFDKMHSFNNRCLYFYEWMSKKIYNKIIEIKDNKIKFNKLILEYVDFQFDSDNDNFNFYKTKEDLLNLNEIKTKEIHILSSIEGLLKKTNKLYTDIPENIYQNIIVGKQKNLTQTGIIIHNDLNRMNFSKLIKEKN